LIPVAINNMGGGEGASDFGSMTNLALAFGTLAFIILVYRFTLGFMRSIAILLGLIAGTIAAILLGKVDFAAVQEASVFHMIQPFYFGSSTFDLLASFTLVLVTLVSLVESTCIYFALSYITEQLISQDDLTKGFRAEGIAIVLGGVFNAFHYSAFSPNV